MGSSTLHGGSPLKIAIQSLDQLMMKMLAGLRAAPVQVGVWIPKAEVGPTADYFRPLGMPNTCDRLVDGTIAAVVHESKLVHICIPRK